VIMAYSSFVPACARAAVVASQSETKRATPMLAV
jgi:hypothetical protein